MLIKSSYSGSISHSIGDEGAVLLCTAEDDQKVSPSHPWIEIVIIFHFLGFQVLVGEEPAQL